MEGRICKKCNVWKLAEEFHKHKRCKGGINTVCKDCRKPVSKQQWTSIPYNKRMLARTKSRATLRGLPFELTLEDINIPEVCPVFNVPMVVGTVYTPSIDRIDSTKGYTKDNIQVISYRANLLKNNATLIELEKIILYMKNNA
jgi:hypothetical protein